MGPPPDTPATPSRIRILPSGLILMTCWPICFVLADGGVGDPDIAVLASTCKPCGVANSLAPMLCTALPVFKSMMCTASRA